MQVLVEQIERRERIRRIEIGNSTLQDRSWEAWADLAKVVRQRVSVPDILRLRGYVLTKKSRNEYSSRATRAPAVLID
jgi:hypothetical protein